MVIITINMIIYLIINMLMYNMTPSHMYVKLLRLLLKKLRLDTKFVVLQNIKHKGKLLYHQYYKNYLFQENKLKNYVKTNPIHL